MLPSALLAAATAAPDSSPGWGKLLALVLTGGLFYLGTRIHERYSAARGKPLFSPATPDPMDGAKPQVSGTDDTTPGTTRKGPAEAVDDLDGFVATKVRTARTSEIIAAAQARYGKSRRTVLRAIKRVRGGQP